MSRGAWRLPRGPAPWSSRWRSAGSTSRRAAPPTRRRRAPIPATRARRRKPAAVSKGWRSAFTLSALDGAACELGVSRERLARALATKQNRERFTKHFHIDNAKLTDAIRAGLVRAVNDAEEHGELNPILAAPIRVTVEHVPLEQGIELVQDAESLLNGESFLGGIGNAIEELLP